MITISMSVGAICCVVALALIVGAICFIYKNRSKCRNHPIVIGMSVISLIISISILIYLCCSGGNCGISNINFADTSVTVLGTIVALLIGWNIYSVIDFKKQSQQINDKGNEVIKSHTTLTEALDEKIEENNKKIEKKMQEERKSMELMFSYKETVSLINSNPDLAFRRFFDIIIQSKKLEEINLFELALAMAEYIARTEDKEKMSDLVKRLTNKIREDFFNEATELIKSLSKDPDGFKDLLDFVNEVYGNTNINNPMN